MVWERMKIEWNEKKETNELVENRWGFINEFIAKIESWMGLG